MLMAVRIVLLSLLVTLSVTRVQAQVVARGNQPAPWGGVYEVVLTSKQPPAQPFSAGLVQFTSTEPN